MDLAKKRARWDQMLVQASHLADLDHTTDAVARARVVLTEVEAVLADTADPETRSELERIHHRAVRRVANYELAHKDFISRATKRADDYETHEKAVYDQPLPVKGLE